MVNRNKNQVPPAQLERIAQQLHAKQKRMDDLSQQIHNLTQTYINQANFKNHQVNDTLKNCYFELIAAVDHYQKTVIWYKNILVNNKIFAECTSDSLANEVASYCKYVLILQLIYDYRRIDEQFRYLDAVLNMGIYTDYLLPRWHAELKLVREFVCES
ncbi:hypothetical protein QZJ86_11240 [Methylomonas montana]|uniref:hypothetical protein n=1 Tax=Methylomonas montana TaxID=3058963 RepID=UPI0026596213|nr:hypothetical protein [Methylomonas montana]WKJ88600.1 hypothetical protein QZJ86_11240 [Methylomonas montana]